MREIKSPADRLILMPESDQQHSLEVFASTFFLLLAQLSGTNRSDDNLHSQRVAYVAASIGRSLKWDSSRVIRILKAGLLVDLGYGHQKSHQSGVQAENMAGSALNNDYYLQLAAIRARRLSITHEFSPILLCLHNKARDSFARSLSEQDKQLSQILYLSEEIYQIRKHFLTSASDDIVVHKSAMVSKLPEYRDPFRIQLVKVASKLMSSDEFWHNIDGTRVTELVNRDLIGKQPLSRRMRVSQVQEVSELMAELVDCKSAYTLGDTQAVAALASHLALEMQYSANDTVQIGLACMMMDVGMLCVPDEALSMDSPLTTDYENSVRKHVYDSQAFVGRLLVDHPILSWIGQHHERLDGSGYPNGLQADDILRESRIIAVADVFQSMRQTRPNRQGLTDQEALNIVKENVLSGKLDGDVVGALERLISRKVNLDALSI